MKHSLYRILIMLVLVGIPFVFVYELLSNPALDMALGEKNFIEQCSKCHRKDGSGIKRVYPPLKNADYIKNGTTLELLRGMIYGRSGTIKVNGYTYTGVMTTEIDQGLSDDDIASILNYVYIRLNNITDRIVIAKDVKDARKAGKLPVHK